MQIGDFLNRLDGVKELGDYWMARCPAHKDSTPSLKVSEGDDGRILVKDFGGCEVEAVVAAMSLTMVDLFVESPANGYGRMIEATYDYRDEDGKLLFQAIRYTPKGFSQRRPDGASNWIYGLNAGKYAQSKSGDWYRPNDKTSPTAPRKDFGETRRVLYRLPELLAANPGATVFIVEGEKDVDRLSAGGLVATCSPMGAGKWRDEYAKPLAGRKVVIIPDNDQAGRDHAQAEAKSLSGVAASVKMLTLSGLPEKGDVSDWLSMGGTIETLRAMAEAAPEWTPGADAEDDLSSHLSHSSQLHWPEYPAKAFYGLAGRIVAAIEPHTEADPVALLIQFLVSFGNLIGRIAYFVAEADKHFCNLFAVIVGLTSKGRKGTSWGQTKNVLGSTDKDWLCQCVSSGLSSGEGLIWAVRDPIEKREPIKEKGRVIDYQTVVTDQGVDDKRLLVVEPEFALVLKTAAREGNTLSATIRQAWDDGNLKSLTKNSPARATDAHISIIGHVTKDELRRHLEDTETANGFANRFLWVCARQSKLLPEGGRLDQVNFSEILKEIQNAADHARKTTEMKRNEEARELWFDVYPELADAEPGLLGAVTGRAEAQVMRLATLYALLDCSAMIGRRHLEAALALWKYCEDSARYIFGEAMGDPIADTILASLKEVGATGMTRTEIRDLFKRHATSSQIDRALESLVGAGRAESRKEETGGRPTERWFARTLTATKATKATKALNSQNSNEVASPPDPAMSATKGDEGQSNEDLLSHMSHMSQQSLDSKDISALSVKNGAGNAARDRLLVVREKVAKNLAKAARNLTRAIEEGDDPAPIPKRRARF